MRHTFALAGLMTLLVVSNAEALPIFLSQDLGVKGLMRYCKYSNGKIYTVNATDLCELSIEDGMQSSGQATGFLAREYEDGMTKVCVYDVLGEKKALRLSSASLCPLNAKF